MAGRSSGKACEARRCVAAIEERPVRYWCSVPRQKVATSDWFGSILAAVLLSGWSWAALSVVTSGLRLECRVENWQT